MARCRFARTQRFGFFFGRGGTSAAKSTIRRTFGRSVNLPSAGGGKSGHQSTSTPTGLCLVACAWLGRGCPLSAWSRSRMVRWHRPAVPLLTVGPPVPGALAKLRELFGRPAWSRAPYISKVRRPFSGRPDSRQTSPQRSAMIPPTSRHGRGLISTRSIQQ